MKRLCDTRAGETVHIRAVAAAGGMKRRLLDLGFTAGANATRLFISPGGDPAAYLVRGAVVALRNRDAAGIDVI